MRYLGIDYGSKRLGLSLSDDRGKFAFPFETIPNDATSVDRIGKIVKKEGVGGIVMGDTRALSGAENTVTEASDVFAKNVTQFTHLKVDRVWEAWSSVEAARFSEKGSAHNDSSAAAIILQRFLDAHPES